jgi:hypothetical protein
MVHCWLTWKKKAFFFEKKKQKTFTYWAEPNDRRGRKCLKVFWFFFSKKNILPYASLIPSRLSSARSRSAAGFAVVSRRGP